MKLIPHENDIIVRNAIIIGNCKLALVPVSEMAIDEAYQRVLYGHVNAIAKAWDIEKCDNLQVSYRDKKFYITDGQHRYMAARINEVKYLLCRIREGLTVADEAAIFVRQNENVRRLSPYDTFKGNLLLGDPVDTAIYNICRKHKVEILKKAGKDAIGILGSLTDARNIVRLRGDHCLDWIFGVIRRCGWNTEVLGYSSYVIRPLNLIFVNHEDEITRITPILIRALSGITPTYFRAEAILEFPEKGHQTAVYTYMEKKIEDALSHKRAG